MKTTTRTIYTAEDGREFHDEAKCQQYEADGCVELFPLPGYGEHGPITDARLMYWVMNGDGSGYYATATKMSRIDVHPTTHPAWATHLVYFGK